METIRVAVGSDPRMGPAEQALERSIRAHTERPVEITWMRAGDEPWTGWRMQPSRPYEASDTQWSTQFSGFRYFVPEVYDSEGFAIYLDADMLLLADIGELWDMRKPGLWMSAKRAVMVIDCAAPTTLPTIEKAKSERLTMSDLTARAPIKEAIPGCWNSRDKVLSDTKLLHFTDMHTQPWKPWPERFNYPAKHPNESAREAWERWA